MRILLLNDDYPPHGQSSVATVTANLASAYAAAGHDVFVLTSHRRTRSSRIERRGNVVSLPISYRPSLRQWLSLYQPRVTRMLRMEMAAIKPDVVHAHNIHTYLTYDSLRIAHGFTAKVFLTAHDVMSFSYWRLKTDRYLASGGTDTRLTISDHLHNAGLQYNPLRNFLIRRTVRKNTHHVVAVSDALKRALDAHDIPRTTVIHNGLDLQRWNAKDSDRAMMRKKYNLDGRKVILFGGRLSIDKGTHPLLQTLSIIRNHIPDVLLLVLGDAKRWNGLLATSGSTEDLSAEIRCTGWVDRTEMPALYAAADVVTVPSLCLDCLPSMALEAMAARKPVVGTIFGGTPEIVEDGKTGFIVDPRDTAQFADRLTRILTDDALAQAMGEAGRARMETHFTVEKQAREYVDLFQKH